MQPTIPLPTTPQLQQTDVILHRLLRQLTLWQVGRLLDELERVMQESGYGKVSIVIERGHTRRIETFVSVDITTVTELLKSQEKPHGQA